MISILNYGLGNIGSISNALEFLHIKYKVINSGEEILKAHKIILPGVGSFLEGMKKIKENFLEEPLKESVLMKKIPILGICLGFQLFAEEGEEGGLQKGLMFIKGSVQKFSFNNIEAKIPHIGFNTVFLKKSKLFENLGEKCDFYFMHSYRFICEEENCITSICNYYEPFVSSIEKENIFGVQFHPEKSQSNGLRVLQNFSNL